MTNASVQTKSTSGTSSSSTTRSFVTAGTQTRSDFGDHHDGIIDLVNNQDSQQVETANAYCEWVIKFF